MLEAICLYESLFEIRMSILNTDGGDTTIAVEMDVFFEDGWEAVVWLDAEECAVDVFWDCAGDFEFVDVAFEAGGLVEALEERSVGELCT